MSVDSLPSLSTSEIVADSMIELGISTDFVLALVTSLLLFFAYALM